MHYPQNRRRLTELWRDESGATAVEYSLLASAIAAVIAVTVFSVGGKVLGLFERLKFP